MTPSDWSKAVRLIAYHLERGEPQAAIESYLGDIAGAMTQQEVARAFQLGRQAQEAGRAVKEGRNQAALINLGLLSQAIPGGLQVLVRYQYGPNAEQDFKSAVVQIAPGTAPAQILGAGLAAVQEALQGQGEGRYQTLQGWTVPQAIQSAEIVYIAPTGMGALP